MKPYSEACERNRDPIFAVIQPLLAARRAVLEIGSGTGQHAVYFAAKLPHLIWHTSDREMYHAGIQLWLDEAALENVRPPLALDVTQTPWPAMTVDAVYSANTAHIMHWPEVEAMFAGVGALLPAGGIFLLYGPFNDHGCYTSDSNRRFDEQLKSRDPLSGIRDADALDRLAQQAQLQARGDVAMPANNRILWWEKRT